MQILYIFGQQAVQLGIPGETVKFLYNIIFQSSSTTVYLIFSGEKIILMSRHVISQLTGPILKYKLKILISMKSGKTRHHSVQKFYLGYKFGPAWLLHLKTNLSLKRWLCFWESGKDFLKWSTSISIMHIPIVCKTNLKEIISIPLVCTNLALKCLKLENQYSPMMSHIKQYLRP